MNQKQFHVKTYKRLVYSIIGEGMTMTENSKIRPFWDVSESQISKFSSTMVKV